jgi:peptidyl-prolyl cis-trans isomerase SurA
MTKSKGSYLSQAMRGACTLAALATLSCGWTGDKVAPKPASDDSRPLRVLTSQPQAKADTPQQSPAAASPDQSPEAAATKQSLDPAPAKESLDSTPANESLDSAKTKQLVDAAPVKQSPAAVSPAQASDAAPQNPSPDAAKRPKGIAFSKKRNDALSAAARGQELDRIVAIVNDEVLTQFELNDRINLIVQQLNKQGTALPEREALARQILERLINDVLQLQLAKQTGLKIDDGQLDKALQRIAQENKLSLPEFRAALEKDNINFIKFRNDIRNEMVLARLREREVDNKITVADSEVDRELELESSQGAGDDEYDVSHILVTVSEQATPEQTEQRRRRAAEALARLAQGDDFAQVAAAYSDAPDALQGANMGWRTAARLPAVFAEAVAKMQKGALSEVLRSANGFHVLKLNDKRGKSVAQVVTQTHARHTLIRISDAVPEAEAKNRILQLKERLDNGEDFAEVAKANSDDDSRAKGGDLGWISPGDTVPEFERALDALREGQISEPLLTPFGWHIVQVLERRQNDVTQERKRLAARQGVRARKADEAYQEWVRQLRDSAYVEYRVEDK